MPLKKLIQTCKKNFFIIILGFFSFFINYHYGFIGVMPLDNFVLYNGGYKVLNGFVPFNDYWLVTGAILDYLNAFFFLLNGVTWKSYIIHSSIFNLIITLLTYILFINLGLSKKLAFFYSLLFSILFYPVVGTPFVDHHSTFFSLISVYFFIFAIIKNNKNYFFYIPLFLILSFLSKQTPFAYIFISLFTLISLYFFYTKEKKKTFLIFLKGSIFALVLTAFFFYVTKIDLYKFIDQYLLFASTIGDFRVSNYKFKILDIFLQYKFINIFLITLLYIFFKIEKKNYKDTVVIISIILFTFSMLFHQHITMNQEFIFFLIPILMGTVHFFYFKVFKQKYILIVLILVCFGASLKYHIRFNEHRKFNELEKVNLNNAIDASILSPSLEGLKWITYKYPTDPLLEITEIKEILQIINSDTSKKMIITDYQILPSVLQTNDFSPNQWHHATVSFPIRNQKYYEKYKNFFIKSLKKNNINHIYETLDNNQNLIIPVVLEDNCFEIKKKTNILIMYKIIEECSDLKNESN